MRWADIDSLAHVNNVVYADYLQEARVDLLRLHVEQPVDGLVVAGHQVRYLAPMPFDAAPVVETWVTEIRSASFVLGYEVYREVAGERIVHARASSVLAPFVLATGRPRRLTPEEKAELAPYLEPAEAPTAEFSTAPAAAASYPLRVRFSDLDPYGHVNNVKHFEYFQEGRLAAVRPALHGIEARPGLVVAQADLVYRRPILFRHEPYQVRTWLTRLGTSSMVVEAEILDGTVQLARARHVMVFWDLAAGRSTVPTEEVRALVTAALSPGC
ncbi:acyl-CoA thioesterase [Nocardioides sp.]|uniref:acyl-CoA thioesterase n=1 Tax=Nocardioides sp. TaxID=35761 RepID=UPI0039E26C70